MADLNELHEPAFERAIWYEYTTICPGCGTEGVRGRWNRPDVRYDNCVCGYVGPLSQRVAEVEVYLPVRK